MIEIQQRSADRAEQMSNEVATYLEYKELAAYMKVKDMINEKCAQEAATSEGTQMDINSLSPEKYNTDSGKSEIRRLVMNFVDSCLEYSNKISKDPKTVKNPSYYPTIRLELTSGAAVSILAVSTISTKYTKKDFNIKEFLILNSVGVSELKKLNKKLIDVLNEIGSVEKDD